MKKFGSNHIRKSSLNAELLSPNSLIRIGQNRSGADAIKKFTPSLGIPSRLLDRSTIWEPLVTPKSGLLNFQELGVQTTKIFLQHSIFKFSKLFRVQESRLLNQESRNVYSIGPRNYDFFDSCLLSYLSNSLFYFVKICRK